MPNPQPPQPPPDVTDQFSSTVGQLVQAYGTLSKIVSVLGPLAATGDVLSLLLGAFSPKKPDPVQEALTDIKQKLDTVLHFEVAHDELEHMFHVNDVIKDAATDWQTLVEGGFAFDTP
ncbi:MAG: hypothetical protein JO023_05050, partial [Chloroflexi bacterium]|nr:hypothetical protein [Chloroflexota bacterium]